MRTPHMTTPKRKISILQGARKLTMKSTMTMVWPAKINHCTKGVVVVARVNLSSYYLLVGAKGCYWAVFVDFETPNLCALGLR
jgi:hypothetical protein